jgi:phosphoglycolate phosphatase
VFNHLLCDLDGTLVDSSAGILNTLRSCLASARIPPGIELTSRLIGPPLRAMLEAATGRSDLNSLSEIEVAFRREYDERGYLATRAYPGIAEALTELRDRGVRLHVVTNKRRAPTLRILDMLGWAGTFLTVNTLDSNSLGTTKAHVVAQLLPQLDVSISSVVLVGDSLDDASAARENGVAFGWARWGYGLEADLGGLGVPLIDARQLVQLVLPNSAAGVVCGP